MPSFHYQAQNAAREEVAGEVHAATLAEAVAELESRGLAILTIGTAPLPPPAGGESPSATEASARRAQTEEAALTQHLARVMEQGRELLPALRAYSQELPAGRRREFDTVLQVLERGDPSQAAATLTTLPGYWIPLLGAATASRDPGRILREFVEESERASQLQRQWWMTLAYPTLLGVPALAVLVLISIIVIPIFREIFTGFGLRLPVFTITVLSVAEWISSGRIVIWTLGIIVGLWLLRRGVRHLPVGVRNWCGDHWPFRFGRATALARLSQFTADLLEAQLDPPQALRLAGLATGNAPLRRAAQRAAEDAEAGSPFANASARRQLTATILHALAQDSAPEARIQLLREISAGYAERARKRLSWTRGIIEPLAICAIGFVVGATVVALFLPLVTLVQGLA